MQTCAAISQCQITILSLQSSFAPRLDQDFSVWLASSLLINPKQILYGSEDKCRLLAEA